MTDDDNIPDPEDIAREKLLRSKEKWAEEGRLLTGRPDAGRVNRLPPGQRLVTNWPVLDLGAQPDVNREKWRLRIGGLVEKPQVFTLEEFHALPQAEMVSDIHCVTAWSRYDNRWKGVSTKTIIDMVRPKADARYVLFQSYDGYTTNVRLDVFAETNALLAHEWEGAAAHPRAWRAGARRDPGLVFLEEPQMGDPDRILRRRPPRLLGSPRLPQRRRSVERRAV